ncbi:LRR receptor-like serine/threonine-protein kinase HSL2 [Acorus calamus]|uniref:non-specific serine/threonine protein kinase n=1 Tax=Acorus calamus TaxID=4465 RepID=A0AAV9FEQ1_ACOCL|nr:LRR receptor-like serine/threonine-protein kinase HSL2 [Acorus calamus]
MLELFDVSSNRLEGGLPRDLCFHGRLRSLVAFNNRLSGAIPSTYGTCASLSYVRIQNNSLSGPVPESVWGLPNLYYLEIRNNRLEGPIAPSISGASNLTQLIFSHNRFSGVIPPEICLHTSLSFIDAGDNMISGEIPHCINALRNLEKLELENNQLSGEIPKNVSSWRDLTELNLSGNRFTGSIPGQLGSLPVLTYLDLSGNSLSGEIPPELAELKLNSFNVSLNDLSGRIPAGLDSRLYATSLAGNPKLCSGGSDLKPFVQPCSLSNSPNRSVTRNARTTFYVTAVLLASALALAACLSCLVYRQRRTRAKKNRRASPSWKLTSFHRMNGFDEVEILDSLNEANIIGTGGSGQVYRVRLKTGQTVAVKKLWGGPRKLETERDFRSEVETLGRVRHGNIVKLLLCCTDGESRILVYEYMENGSLGEALHGEKGGTLDWDQRVKIAIGAAQGLAYLHHDCVPPIIHRDVKSNNILLDAEFCPRVSDFGLARMLQSGDSCNNGGGDRVMSNVAGSCGYIAPEYAYALKVNEKSDVYSFGVVLLELVTGKRAVDPTFGEGKDIVKWVTDELAMLGGKGGGGGGGGERELEHIMDARLTTWQYEELLRVLNVGLMCTAAFPMNRPSMRKVVELLKERRDHVGFLVACEK